MCEPLTLASIAISTGLSVASNISEGNQQAEAAETNRQLANMAEADAVRRGMQDAGRARAIATRQIGALKVAAGQSGIDSSSKSVQDLMADTRLVSELDAQNIQTNAAREAFGYRVQAYNYGVQARNARTRAATGGFSTILGGVAQGLNTVGRFFGSK